MDRTRSSIKNVAITMIGAIVTMLLQLVNRKVFVLFLSSEYLGLSGLFSDILSMLSLSEMGIGTAMVYALYKPVADKDIEKIKSLMLLYKRIYTIIGCFILFIGVALTPFLGGLINEMPDIPYIHLYFVMYILDAGMSYFYTYKRSLIICNRENYISSMTMMFSSIGLRATQLLVLLFTHNYFLFLLVQIIFTRLENVVISKIAEKKYPYLKEKNIRPLDKETTDQIRRNTFAMITHKIGNAITSGTDNIIVSKILGLVTLGIYSNYHLLIVTVNGMIIRVFNSITSNVGNLIVKKDRDDVERVFYNVLFVNFWVYSWCSVCFFCLLQPFIKLWLGEEFLLSNVTVYVIVAVFYFSGMRNTLFVFRDAAGIFYQDRYKAILESVVNLLCSIPLTIYLGVTGVKLGTLIAVLSTGFWIEGYVLFKHYFRKKVTGYLLRQGLYAAVTIGISVLLNQFCVTLDNGDIRSFIIQCAICIIAPNLLLMVVFFKTKEFRYFGAILGRGISRYKKRDKGNE